QKSANTEMSQLPKGSPEFMEKVAEMKALSAEAKAKDGALKDIEEQWSESVLSIPNLPDDSVPEGKDENDNVVAREHGEIPAEELYQKPHYEIDWIDEILDFKRGTKVTGSGFPFFVGDGARLVRSLIAFFLDE